MMDIDNFIKNIASQLDDTDASKITAQTKFREEIEEWDSLIALSVIAMVDDVYGVVIKGSDIGNCTTIEDLFNIVKSRK
jgi:acyl carrier protein